MSESFLIISIIQSLSDLKAVTNKDDKRDNNMPESYCCHFFVSTE